MEAVKEVVAGTAGGLAVCFVGHPFDTLKVRLQTQPAPPNHLYSGLMDCVAKTVKWEGVGGLYKGVASPAVGQMFFRASLFSTFAATKTAFTPYVNDPVKVGFMAGAVTGGVVALVESPIDLFKSQVQYQIVKQRQSPDTPLLFRNVFQCASYIWRHGSLPGVYQGLMPTMVRDSIGYCAFFGVNQMVKDVFDAAHPGQQSSILRSLAAGSIGGLIFWLAVYPIDVIKSAMQTDAVIKGDRRFKSTMDCARQLWKEGGVKRYLKGFTPCLMRSLPANGAMVICYDQVRLLLG
eukprot:TRINITY_DN6825_c0_g1_i2.p2 TRINITY_DN6825_c0_g1~~TRINITY_DN6825_c0_g1_i2.p2  ORF type:complete len:332 (-),score=95.78 TRINITY_DN6825_c0_g1_i2:106-981(-)